MTLVAVCGLLGGVFGVLACFGPDLPDREYRGEGRLLTEVDRGAPGTVVRGDHDPVIEGRSVVWRGADTGAIHLYDFASDTSRLLTDPAERRRDYDVQAGRGVWTSAADTGAGGQPTRLRLLEVESRAVRTVVGDSAIKTEPSLWGSRLVWTDHRHGNPEIYLQRLDTDERRRLTENTASDHDPVVWRDKVAWVRGRRGRLHLLDLATGRRTVVEQSVVVSPPDLHSGHLVWEDHRGNSGDVYLYDLATGQQRRLGAASDVEGTEQSNPQVWEDVVVWRDNRWGPDDIYLYDLAENSERLINTGLGSYRADPDVSHGTVVWIADSRYRGYGLYGLVIE